jgi:hypothetical protein
MKELNIQLELYLFIIFINTQSFSAVKIRNSLYELVNFEKIIIEIK